MYRNETNPQPAPGIAIDGPRVYNPNQDYKRYDELRKENLPEALKLHAMLLGMVSASDVGGKTLADYLYGKDGFFKSNRDIREIMVLNGRLYPSGSHYKPSDLCMFGEEYNGIPFVFESHSFKTD